MLGASTDVSCAAARARRARHGERFARTPSIAAASGTASAALFAGASIDIEHLDLRINHHHDGPVNVVRLIIRIVPVGAVARMESHE